MKIRHSRRAVKQINEVYEYIAVNNPAAADRFLRRIEGLATLLVNFPAIGRRADEHDVRVIGLRPYPYLMFYTVAPDTAELHILRILHMARQRRPI
jgi:toxin ParE1/3/4